MITAETINAVMMQAATPVHTEYLTASRWKPCDRAMWFTLRNVSTTYIKPETQRTFNIGHALEPLMVCYLEMTGAKVHKREAELLNRWGKPFGHIDGIVEIGKQFHLLEMKTANAARFKEMVKNGPPSYYMAQMQLYMHHSDQLSKHGNRLLKCLFIVLCKDSSDIHIEWVDYNPSFAESESNRMHHIIECENLPEPTADFTCRFCDHKAVCEGDAEPAINCRTCANVSATNGTFTCQHGTETCDKHVFHPHLMGLSGHEVCGVDAEKMIIDYGAFAMAPAGVKMPGKATFTSAEYVMAQRTGITQDAILLDTMSAFDATLESAEVPF